MRVASAHAARTFVRGEVSCTNAGSRACAIPHDWPLEVRRNLHRGHGESCAPYREVMSPKKVAPKKVKLVAVITPLATSLRPTGAK
jgi:hypothetical protein